MPQDPRQHEGLGRRGSAEFPISAPRPGSLAISTIIHCIRHGQSTFNAAYELEPVDPLHWDAPLTELGREQARAAAAQVRDVPYELIVTSPLTRALQTTLTLFGDHPSAGRIRVESLHRECLESSCDVGRAPVALRQDFPDLTFDHLDEVWWHRDGEPDHRGLVLESREILDERVRAFRDWLQGRPERLIAVVGHGTFFFHMTGRFLRNCEIAVLEL
jgi:broad specificity phosphatase PhoE